MAEKEIDEENSVIESLARGLMANLLAANLGKAVKITQNHTGKSASIEVKATAEKGEVLFKTFTIDVDLSRTNREIVISSGVAGLLGAGAEYQLEEIDKVKGRLKRWVEYLEKVKPDETGLSPDAPAASFSDATGVDVKGK